MDGASRGLRLGLANEYLKRGRRVVATVRGSTATELPDLAEQAAGKLEIAKSQPSTPVIRLRSARCVSI
jgi:NAD(P)-dependent dehydrogenase (short-subunit alcohol dehydrogenase family)